ncbi:phage head-tail adapter protein, partial [Staphylococcus aureus]
MSFRTIEIGEVEVAGTFPKEYKRFKSNETIKGFMDTPTSSVTLKFHQMSKDLDRNLYMLYHIPITNKTLFNYEGTTYENVRELVD